MSSISSPGSRSESPSRSPSPVTGDYLVFAEFGSFCSDVLLLQLLFLLVSVLLLLLLLLFFLLLMVSLCLVCLSFIFPGGVQVLVAFDSIFDYFIPQAPTVFYLQILLFRGTYCLLF